MKLKTILISSLLACGAFAQNSQYIGGSYGIANDGEFGDGLQGDFLLSLEYGIKQQTEGVGYVGLSLEFLYSGFSEGAIETDNFGFFVNGKAGVNLTNEFSLYGGVGIGFIASNLEIGFNDASEAVFGYQAFAGIEFNPTEKFGIFVQYRFVSGSDFEGLEFTGIDDSFVDIGARFYF